MSDQLISQVVASTSSISSTLTLLLVSGMLLVLAAIGVGLIARLAAHLAWARTDWQEDRRDLYRWHLRSALTRMQGLGLNPHTVIALALKDARARSERDGVQVPSPVTLRN